MWDSRSTCRSTCRRCCSISNRSSNISSSTCLRRRRNSCTSILHSSYSHRTSTSIHLEGRSSSILSSSGILSSSSLTSSTSSTSSRPCRRNSALHQRSTPAPQTPNTHGTPCQRTSAWPLPIAQQMLPPCERLTRQCQRHPKPQQSPNPKEQQTSSSLTFIRFLRNT